MDVLIRCRCIHEAFGRSRIYAVLLPDGTEFVGLAPVECFLAEDLVSAELVGPRGELREVLLPHRGGEHKLLIPAPEVVVAFGLTGA